MKVSEVFVAGGEPQATYVSRDDLKLESSITYYLEDKHKLLSVSGPTKFGKTVLVRKIIPKSAGIWISGGGLETIDVLWETILERLGGHTTVAETRGTTTSQTGDRKLEASIAPGGVGGKFGSNYSEAQSSDSKSQTARTVASSVASLQRLQEENIPLIIDDFHYLDHTLQRKIVRALKDPIFGGLPVVFISVPHRAFDSIKVEKEMTGRVTVVEIPDWSEDDLREIAEKGFKELNANVSSEVLNRLAKECFGSPHLMQYFCKRLCRENGFVEAQISEALISEPDNWDEFFRSSASQTAKLAFDKLAAGPRQRSDRIIRRLSNGEDCDIYRAVLTAIAYTGPSTEINYEDLRTAVKEILRSSPPQAREITRVLEKMTEIARDKIEGEPVIEWSKDDSKLFISDPFFAYYLRWAVRI